MNNNLTSHYCRHCRKRLPFGATAMICRKCRFDGHREFGECLKCPSDMDIPVTNLNLSEKINELGKLS